MTRLTLDFSDVFEDGKPTGLIDFSDTFDTDTSDGEGGRTFGTIAEDTWRSFATGANNMLGGVASLVGADETADTLRGYAQQWDAGVSPELQLSRRRAQIRAQENSKANEAEYGDGVIGFLADAKDSAVDLVTNPDLLLDAAAASAPYMVPGGVGARAGAAIGAGRAAAAGASAERISKAAATGARAGATATGATLEGADARMNARDTVAQMGHEDLLQFADGYANAYHDKVAHYRSQGYFKDAAEELAKNDMAAVKQQIMDDAGRAAFAVSAAISAGANWLGSKPDAAVFGGKAAREATGPVGAAKTVAVEALQEVPEEMGNQFGQNVGVQTFADESRELNEGLGQAAGQGFVMGGVQGGGLAVLDQALRRVADNPENAQVFDPADLDKETADAMNIFTPEELEARRSAPPVVSSQREEDRDEALAAEDFALPERQPEAADPVGVAGVAGDLILAEQRARNREAADRTLRDLAQGTEELRRQNEQARAEQVRQRLMEGEDFDLPTVQADSTHQQVEGAKPSPALQFDSEPVFAFDVINDRTTKLAALRRSIEEGERAVRAAAEGAVAGRREDTAEQRRALKTLAEQRSKLVSESVAGQARYLSEVIGGSSRVFDAKRSTLLEAVAFFGGVNAPYASSHGFDPADMKRVNTEFSQRIGKGLFRSSGEGKTFDTLGEILHEKGYFSARPTENEVIDAVNAELAGRPRYSAQYVPPTPGVPTPQEIMLGANTDRETTTRALRKIAEGKKLSSAESRVAAVLQQAAETSVDAYIGEQQGQIRNALRQSRSQKRVTGVARKIREAVDLPGLRAAAGQTAAEIAEASGDLSFADEAAQIEQSLYDQGVLQAASVRTIGSLASSVLYDNRDLDVAVYREIVETRADTGLDALVAIRGKLLEQSNEQDEQGGDRSSGRRSESGREATERVRGAGPDTGAAAASGQAWGAQGGPAAGNGSDQQVDTDSGSPDALQSVREGYRRDMGTATLRADIDRRVDAYKRLLACLRAG